MVLLNVLSNVLSIVLSDVLSNVHSNVHSNVRSNVLSEFVYSFQKFGFENIVSDDFYSTLVALRALLGSRDGEIPAQDRSFFFSS